MLDNQGITNSTQGQQFMEGADVLDVNGEKVGTVSEHGVQDDCLVIHHGLLREDVYIPLGVIDSNDAQGVYLTITKDQALNQDWSTIPAQETVTSGTTTPTMAQGTATEAEDVRVPVVEEELVAGKRADELGRVHLHKDVVEEQQTVPVTLQREEVTVERVPVQGKADVSTADAFTEKDIDVPVMGEEAVVEKQPRVTEEVRLRKNAMTEQQQVSDTVRKERVVVDGADETPSTNTVREP